MDPETERDWEAESWVCFACEAKARANRRHADGEEAGSTDGLYFTVTREMAST